MTAGVGYVEFSVGINDLSNPRINKYLLPEYALKNKKNKHFIKYAKGWNPPVNCEDEDITPFRYNFLMAFPRNLSAIGNLPKDIRRKFVILFSAPYVSLVDNSVQPVTQINHPRDVFLNKLFTFKGANMITGWVKKLKQIYNREENKEIKKHCVGLDLVGEEDGNPFSPFLNQSKIQAFICALKVLFFRKYEE
jgi:hypothetical protein